MLFRYVLDVDCNGRWEVISGLYPPLWTLGRYRSPFGALTRGIRRATAFSGRDLMEVISRQLSKNRHGRHGLERTGRLVAVAGTVLGCGHPAFARPGRSNRRPSRLKKSFLAAATLPPSGTALWANRVTVPMG